MKDLIKHFRRLLTKREFPITFIGNALNAAFYSFAFIIVTRNFTPAQYGTLSVALLVQEIAIAIAELGLDIGGTRFASKYLRQGEQEKCDAVHKTIFLTKLAAGLLLFFGGQLLAGPLAEYAFQDAELAPLFRVALLGIFGRLLSQFLIVYYSSKLQFTQTSIVMIGLPLTTLLSVSLLALSGNLNVLTVLLTYSFSPLVPFLIWLVLAEKGFLRARLEDHSLLLRILSFSKWVYTTNFSNSLGFRLNTFLLSNMTTQAAVGIYNYADKMASMLNILLTDPIMLVLTPKASAKINSTEMGKFIRRTHIILLTAIAPMIGGTVLTRFVINLLAPQFIDAVWVFNILFISILLEILTLPTSTILYSIHRPHVETYIEIAMLIITAAASLVLIPRYGAIGAATSMLIRRASYAVMLLWYGYFHIFKKIDQLPLQATEVQFADLPMSR